MLTSESEFSSWLFCCNCDSLGLTRTRSGVGGLAFGLWNFSLFHLFLVQASGLRYLLPVVAMLRLNGFYFWVLSLFFDVIICQVFLKSYRLMGYSFLWSLIDLWGIWGNEWARTFVLLSPTLVRLSCYLLSLVDFDPFGCKLNIVLWFIYFRGYYLYYLSSLVDWVFHGWTEHCSLASLPLWLLPLKSYRLWTL